MPDVAFPCRVDLAEFVLRIENGPTVHLMPGHFHVAEPGQMIETILGSCVATCLRDEKSGISGVNHFLLPGRRRGDEVESARFGIHAMDLLIEEMVRRGASRIGLSAKVFGGGQVLDNVARFHIGERNVSFALSYLEGRSIPVVAKDVGGLNARRLRYNSRTNEALVKTITTRDIGELVRSELDYETKMRMTMSPRRT